MKLLASVMVFLAPWISLAGSSPYRILHEIAIGGEGGWDYVSIDPGTNRLFLAQSKRIVVVSLKTEQIVGEIPNIVGAHGFAIAPELTRGFASGGKENQLTIVNLSTLKPIMKVPTGEDPDAVVYEQAHQEVYVFNGHGNSVTVINAKTGAVVTTIPLPGTPEFAVADPASHRVFVAIEDHGIVVAIDTEQHAVHDQWPVAPGTEPAALSIDRRRHRLFIGCGNKKMLMMDSQSGKVMSEVPIGGGVDANVFDAEKDLAFSANGEGNLTIARTDVEGMRVVQTLETEKGARTLALDPKTHRVYLPTAKFSAPRKPVAGTLKLLVVGR